MNILDVVEFKKWVKPTDGQVRVYVNGMDELKGAKAFFYVDENGFVDYDFKKCPAFRGMKALAEATNETVDGILMTIRNAIACKNGVELPTFEMVEALAK